MGRPPYQAAHRLLAIAEARWAEVDAAYLQVDILTLPFDRFLNAVYAWCVQQFIFAPPEKREEFDTMLTAPLETEGQSKTDKYKFSDEASADSFMAAMGQRG